MFRGEFVPIQFTAAIAVLVLGGLAMYWRAARSIKPRSRRRLRRANTMVLVVLTLNAVHALSMVTVEDDPATFMISWIGVVFFSVFAVALAFLDSINNVRVHRQEKRAMREERHQLIKTMERRIESDA